MYIKLNRNTIFKNYLFHLSIRTEKVRNKFAGSLIERNVIPEVSIMLNARELNDEIKTDSSERKSITILNTDCLELIFKHLEFNDLLNVTDSSKHFYDAACQVYKTKFTNMNPIYAKCIIMR